MAIEPVKVGLIGCGNISDIYLKNNAIFEAFDIVACADLLPERAAAKAAAHNIPRACPVAELLADKGIEMVLNLTIPMAHAEVDLAAIKAGKHIYAEKPLGIARDEGAKVLAAAKKKGVLVGSAPDTFLGGGLQTCRKLIDDGVIGEPVAATAFMLSHGPEKWHPDPEFFYRHGGGPMFDMGPYYLTALVNMLGPVKRVTGSARASFGERTIGKGAKTGQKITVDIPTHIVGVLDFASGAVGTIVTSFDVWSHNLPKLEIYGSLGTLSVPDPNTFGGPVKVRLAGGEWTDAPLTYGYAENSRGLGLADMAAAIRTGRPHRASGQLAMHVLDVMQTIHEASSAGKHLEISSKVERPAPLPLGLLPGTVD